MGVIVAIQINLKFNILKIFDLTKIRELKKLCLIFHPKNFIFLDAIEQKTHYFVLHLKLIERKVLSYFYTKEITRFQKSLKK